MSCCNKTSTHCLVLVNKHTAPNVDIAEFLTLGKPTTPQQICRAAYGVRTSSADIPAHNILGPIWYLASLLLSRHS
jgi:hypothetical protein